MATAEDDNKALSCPEIEQGVSNHPLADDCEESSIASSSAYAAELVQSAARSLLDASTSQLSDDASCLAGKASPSPMASLSLLVPSNKRHFLRCQTYKTENALL
jgi:hypothetical protein